jgi:hypothetical protein
MKEKMPWLKTRLREMGRTPTALAKHLGIAPPRVYEMIAGRRHIQSSEIAPMAAFLDWSVGELNRHLPEHSRAVVVAPEGTRPLVVIDGQHRAMVVKMLDDAPKPVDAQEVKAAVLAMITERFKGRPIVWDTIEDGLALACMECKLASLSQSSG